MLYNLNVKKRGRDLKRNHLLTALVAVVLLVGSWFAFNYSRQISYVLSSIKDAGIQLAAVILSHNPKSVAEIKSHYDPTSQARVRILLVPGHEPNYGGAEYGSLKERDMTVELAQDLQQLLGNNPHYQVFATRDGQSWSPEFASYFNDHWNDISEWQQASHDEEAHLVAIGSTTIPLAKVFHNNAPHDVALRLYGITKWANENDIDIVIHIHFNDYPGHRSGTPGDYSGFTIYVPTAQYGNSGSTRAVADTIFKRLAKYNPVSNLPGESDGVVDDPELIAIGANNTSDAASMLIEYSYIYEPQILNPELRSTAIKDFAFQTYLGLQDFFDPSDSVRIAKPYDTLILPHTWTNPLADKNAAAPDVFALQTALTFEGIYPPTGRLKNDCPRTGVIGACTKTALQTFQNKYGISGESGKAGMKTIQTLNTIY